MIVFLIGFMGAGKSTLGKCLAKQLQTKFVDLDAFISEQEKMTITEIFATKGEGYFRAKERLYLEQISQLHSSAIVALGGGTPCFNNNMAFINTTGKSIYIKTSVQELFNRLKNNKAERPLIKALNDDDLLHFIQQKLTEREPFYLQSHYVLNGHELNSQFLKSIGFCDE